MAESARGLLKGPWIEGDYGLFALDGAEIAVT